MDPFDFFAEQKPAPNEDIFREIEARVETLVERNDQRQLATLAGMALSALSAATHIHNPKDCSEGCQHQGEIMGHLVHVMASGKSLGLLAEAEIGTMATAAVMTLAIMAPDDAGRPETPQEVLDVMRPLFHGVEDDPDGWDKHRREIRDGLEMYAALKELQGLPTTDEPEISF